MNRRQFFKDEAGAAAGVLVGERGRNAKTGGHAPRQRRRAAGALGIDLRMRSR